MILLGLNFCGHTIIQKILHCLHGFLHSTTESDPAGGQGKDIEPTTGIGDINHLANPGMHDHDHGSGT